MATENIKILLKVLDGLGMKYSMGIYEGDAREFAVYSYQQKTVDSADNQQMLYESVIRLTVYTENDMFELYDNLKNELKLKGFIVEDDGYNGKDNNTGLYYFAVTTYKEEL